MLSLSYSYRDLFLNHLILNISICAEGECECEYCKYLFYLSKFENCIHLTLGLPWLPTNNTDVVRPP